jgi:DNA-binding LacI/PurR family transcriptional regulator
LRNSPRVAAHTRVRVAAAARTLEYRPQRHAAVLPKRYSTLRVGVVAAIGLDELLTDPFQVTVITGLVEVLEAAGATPTFVPPPNQTHHLALLSRIPLTGVVLVHSPEASGPAWTVVSRRALPTVGLEVPPGSTIPGVKWLDALALERLSALIRHYGHTDALVVSLPFGGTHRRRGFVPIPDPARVPSQPVRQRLAALTDAGLTVSRVYETERSSLDEGERAGAAITTLGDLPTVIVCQSDVLAAGVITALQRVGVRVPQDVSVTGFDGLDLPLIAPHRLTTVVQDGHEKGRRAATQLLQLMAGTTPEPNDMTVLLREGTTLSRARVGEFLRPTPAAP